MARKIIVVLLLSLALASFHLAAAQQPRATNQHLNLYFDVATFYADIVAGNSLGSWGA